MSQRLRRAFLWGASLLALGALGLLVVVPFAIRRAVTPALIAGRVSSALGREVEVGGVGLHFKPLLRVRLEQVAIPPNLALGTVDVALRIPSLLEGRIEVARLEVDDASVTVVRRADGELELHGGFPVKPAKAEGEGGRSEHAVARALRPLPEIELRRATVMFVDRAVADPPLRIPLRVGRLELEAVAAGESPRLAAQVALGEGGEGGLLTLEAVLGPLEGGAPILEQRFRAELRVAGLAPSPLLPYLRPHLDVRRLEGALEGRASLEGTRGGELAADLAVSLVGGDLDLSGVRLSAPRFEGHVRRSDAAFAVSKARLETPLLEIAAHRLQGLRAGLSYGAGSVDVDSLELDSYSGSWRRSGAATAGKEGATDLELHVERTGGIALRGRLHLPLESGGSAGRRLDIELPEAEVEGAEVQIVDRGRSGTPAASLHVNRLRLRDFAEGRTGSLFLDARAGEDGGEGTLILRGEVGPLAWEKPLAELPVSLELTAEAMDLASLVAYAPERWRPSRAAGVLAAKIDAEGSSRAGSAQVALTLEEGDLEMAGIALRGTAAFQGLIRRRGDAVALEAGRLTSETLSVAGRPAEDLRAAFAFADGALEIESLDLRAFGGTVHQTGRLVPGETPSFGLRVEVAAVDAGRLLGVATEGTEPTLLDGEAAIRGRWSDQPDWLEPLGGEGRVLLHGGMVPSEEDLLTAVARSLLGLVPGSSHLLRKNPRLARLERLTSTFRIEAGRVRTDDLRVRTEDFWVSGRGSVGSRADLDFDLEVALTTRGVYTVFALDRAHPGLREGTMLPAVPVKMSGSPRHPSYRADATAFPVATLKAVLGLPGRAGALARGVVGTARGAAGAAGGKLVEGARRLGGQSGPSPSPPAVHP